jgi:hypothetical protein
MMKEDEVGGGGSACRAWGEERNEKYILSFDRELLEDTRVDGRILLK